MSFEPFALSLSKGQGKGHTANGNTQDFTGQILQFSRLDQKAHAPHTLPFIGVQSESQFDAGR